MKNSKGKNTTICFNEDEMYIFNYFKDLGGKTSTEMKRVLKDFVDNDGKSSDFLVDERVSRIVSGILGGVNPSFIPRVELSPDTSNLDDSKIKEDVQDEDVDVAEDDFFDLPPQDIALGIHNSTGFPFINEDLNNE